MSNRPGPLARALTGERVLVLAQSEAAATEAARVIGKQYPKNGRVVANPHTSVDGFRSWGDGGEALKQTLDSRRESGKKTLLYVSAEDEGSLKKVLVRVKYAKRHGASILVTSVHTRVPTSRFDQVVRLPGAPAIDGEPEGTSREVVVYDAASEKFTTPLRRNNTNAGGKARRPEPPTYDYDWQANAPPNPGDPIGAYAAYNRKHSSAGPPPDVDEDVWYAFASDSGFAPMYSSEYGRLADDHPVIVELANVGGRSSLAEYREALSEYAAATGWTSSELSGVVSGPREYRVEGGDPNARPGKKVGFWAKAKLAWKIGLAVLAVVILLVIWSAVKKRAAATTGVMKYVEGARGVGDGVARVWRGGAAAARGAAKVGKGAARLVAKHS